MMATSHSPGKILLILVAFILFLATIAVNVLATFGGVELGIFQNITGDVSDKYYLEITPASWTFTVWSIIYAWQALWLIYSLVLLCRSNAGEPIYAMDFLPSAVYIFFILNNLCNVGWLFLWDGQFFIIATCLLALTAFTLYCALYYTFSRLYRNFGLMRKRGLMVDVWLVRLFVQNGIAFYATWVTIATLLNLGIVLRYIAGLEMRTTSTILLSVVAVEVVTWFILDVFLLDKYTRYVFSPYILAIIAFTGIVYKNFDLNARFYISVFVMCLLVVAGILLIAKMSIMLVRHCVDSLGRWGQENKDPATAYQQQQPQLVRPRQLQSHRGSQQKQLAHYQDAYYPTQSIYPPVGQHQMYNYPMSVYRHH